METSAKLNLLKGFYILHDLEGNILATCNQNSSTGRKLSNKNCQTIERGYDLDELVKERFGEAFWHDGDKYFKEGFQKRDEILGDKKFSEEDMIQAFIKGVSLQIDLPTFQQSLQQTEWDVEIVMNSWFENGHDGKIVDTNPKLDADGCIILKRNIC